MRLSDRNSPSGGGESDAPSRSSANSIDTSLLLSLGLPLALAWLLFVSVSMLPTTIIAHDELSEDLAVLLMSFAAVSPCRRQGDGKRGHSIGTGSKEGLALVDAAPGLPPSRWWH